MVNSKFLRSRVAKRVFLLFVACALLPMAMLTVLVFLQASGELRSQHDHELQQSAKSIGLVLFERLTMLDSDLQIAALRVQQDAAPATSGQSRFIKIEVWDGKVEGHWGGALSADELAHLRSGRSLVRVAPCSSDAEAKCVVMLKAVDVDSRSLRLVAGAVSADYLWSADKLPANMDLLVLSSHNEILFNSDPSIQSPPALSSRPSSSGFLEWKIRTKFSEAAYRDLFLKPEFLAERWTVVVRQSDRAYFLAMQHLRNTLLLVTLLAMWIVVLFSSIQIRRTMGPLEQLGEGTKRVAEQKFDTRVEVTSGDEFQQLAASFNTMASRLGRQFHTLRAISDIDRAVLASRKLSAIIDTTLTRLSGVLPSDCFAIAIFESESSDVCLAQLTMRERHSNAQLVFGNRIVPPVMVRELRESRALQVSLGGRETPEYLLPLADRGMRLAEVFPIVLDGKLFAAFICGQVSPQVLTCDDREAAREVADRLTVGFSNTTLIGALEQLNWGTLTALARAIDAKSQWTAGHSERVTEMAVRIGRAMKLSERELQIMHRGGLLHDIGKIGTPLEILDKPAALDEQEMLVMREHVQTGVRILEPVATFAEALPIVAQHHEWFNGGGYPAGLAGEQISLHARIFAVADCYDALVSERPYRGGLPKERVVRMLAEKSGTQFDPEVIEVFVRLCAEETTAGCRDKVVYLVESTS